MHFAKSIFGSRHWLVNIVGYFFAFFAVTSTLMVQNAHRITEHQVTQSAVLSFYVEAAFFACLLAISGVLHLFDLLRTKRRRR